ncbi:MAG: (2Fe-2S) ferredoxin domain-containing protein [Deltaproteobacteria bacterium]|nr:(2Fe-2S) ferredoxin domain-containing protein [Deltaproteobacteria bacterium]
MRRTTAELQTESELAIHASGFVVKTEGAWTEAGLAQLRHFLHLRRLDPSDDELLGALDRAKAAYFEASNCLFLCSAQPCYNKIDFDMSDRELARLSADIGAPISKTGCQGPCKQAPVLSLRIGDRQEMFAEVANEDAWRAVIQYAKAAAQAGTLLVDSGAAEKFRFDPVHDHGKPSAHVQPLEFLVGHFRGEGKYAMTDYVFQKEVVGSFEAGGRFISLRMNATYPLADGRKDVHKALVIVGAEPAGTITAHAYTDGGTVREYAIARNQSKLEFADLPPGHASQGQRARKILQPTADGFEERLEVDAGTGFVPYYVIAMRKM